MSVSGKLVGVGPANMEKRSKPFWARGWVLVTAILAFTIIGGGALLFLPQHLLNEWLPSTATADERNRALGLAGQVVLFALGGIIALVGVGVSLSRHGEELEAAERDRARQIQETEREQQRRAELDVQRLDVAERTFRDRFVAAVELMSSDSAPTKRSAGIYAMFALAQDWLSIGRGDEHQVCIDVVCGYLRAPAADSATVTPGSEREVRITAYRLLGQVLRTLSGLDGEDSLRLDLSGALIDFPVEWARASLGRNMRIHLRGARVTAGGSIDMKHASFRNGAVVDASDIRVDSGGRVSLHGATVGSGSRVLFVGSVFEAGSRLACTELKARGGALVSFQRSSISDDSEVVLSQAEVENATLSWTRVRIIRQSRFVLSRVSIADSGRLLVKGVSVGERSHIQLSGIALEGESELVVAIKCDDSSRVTETGITVDDTSVVNRGGRKSRAGAPLVPTLINTVEKRDVLAVSGVSRTALDRFQLSSWVPDDDQDHWSWADVRRVAILNAAIEQNLGDAMLSRLSEVTREARLPGCNVLIVTEDAHEWVPRRKVSEYLDSLESPVVFQVSLRDIEPRMRIVQRQLARGVEVAGE